MPSSRCENLWCHDLSFSRYRDVCIVPYKDDSHDILADTRDHVLAGGFSIVLALPLTRIFVTFVSSCAWMASRLSTNLDSMICSATYLQKSRQTLLVLYCINARNRPGAREIVLSSNKLLTLDNFDFRSDSSDSITNRESWKSSH